MRVLVTGGSSLMGVGVAASLTDRGDQVVTLQRTPTETSVPVTGFAGSITDPGIVSQAVAGCDAVVHLAARVGIVGSYDEFFDTNVRGTRVLLEAARAAGVSRFVLVSSPSVAHAGEALVGAGAQPADPSATRGHYSTTKAIAEREALAQNGDELSVVAIRPHLVWGPADTQLVGRILERAEQGRLAYVGTGAALIDSTYLTNAVDALVAAVDRCPEIGGRALVVSNGEPRPIRDLVDGILAAHGVESPERYLPRAVAFAAGWIAERAWARFAPDAEPPMTTFLAEQLATAHWFDQRETQRLLQWEPSVSIDEGLALLRSAG